MPWDQFPGNRPNKPQSPNDVASKPLPKTPANSSLDNVAPQMIVRLPRVRPGKFVFSEAKRLLQHNRHETDMPTALREVRSQGQSGKHMLGLSSSQFDPLQTTGFRSAATRRLRPRRSSIS